LGRVSPDPQPHPSPSSPIVRERRRESVTSGGRGSSPLLAEEEGGLTDDVYVFEPLDSSGLGRSVS